jgi:hypothetical protein
MNDTNLYDRLLALWNIHEMLLQSYRRIFITAQSFIYAGAVAVATTSVPWFSIPFMVLGLLLVKHWRDICKSRGNDVWFIQLQILKLEDGQNIEPNIYGAIKKWQKIEHDEQVKLLKETMDKSNQHSLGLDLVMAKTRKIMEETVPLIFVVLWWLIPLLIAFRILVMYNVIRLP